MVAWTLCSPWWYLVISDTADANCATYRQLFEDIMPLRSFSWWGTYLHFATITRFDCTKEHFALTWFEAIYHRRNWSDVICHTEQHEFLIDKVGYTDLFHTVVHKNARLHPSKLVRMVFVTLKFGTSQTSYWASQSFLSAAFFLLKAMSIKSLSPASGTQKTFLCCSKFEKYSLASFLSEVPKPYNVMNIRIVSKPLWE